MFVPVTITDTAVPRAPVLGEILEIVGAGTPYRVKPLVRVTVFASVFITVML
jgi:hypothetical protein